MGGEGSSASLCALLLTPTQSGRRGLGEGTKHAPRSTPAVGVEWGAGGHREDVTASRPEDWTWASGGSSHLLSSEYTLSPPLPRWASFSRARPQESNESLGLSGWCTRPDPSKPQHKLS